MATQSSRALTPKRTTERQAAPHASLSLIDLIFFFSKILNTSYIQSDCVLYLLFHWGSTHVQTWPTRRLSNDKMLTKCLMAVSISYSNNFPTLFHEWSPKHTAKYEQLYLRRIFFRGVKVLIDYSILFISCEWIYSTIYWVKLIHSQYPIIRLFMHPLQSLLIII